MSDPMTNAEVEDVLSSIRRLVSEETRAEAAPAAPEAPRADRLVLTPALRIETPAVETQTDSFELLQPAETDDVTEDAWLDSEPASDGLALSEPESAAPEDEVISDADDAAIGAEEAGRGPETAGQTELDQAGASGDITALADNTKPADVARDNNQIGWSLAMDTRARHAPVKPGVLASLFKASVTEPEDTAADDGTVDNVMAEDESAALEATASDNLGLDAQDAAEVVEPSDADVSPNQEVDPEEGEDDWASAADDEDVLADDAAEDWLADNDATPDLAGDDSAEDNVAAAPFVHVELDEEDDAQDAPLQESGDVVQLDAPKQEVPSLSDKIAALETLVARGRDEFEPDQAGESDIAAAAEPTVEWDDVEAHFDDDAAADEAVTAEDDVAPEVDAEDVLTQPEETPASEGAAVFMASARTVAPDVEGEVTLDVEGEVTRNGESELTTDDESVLDEDVLREIVSDIVREELQGALGERITRNVRKLVRREIHRALAAQDLD